MKNEESNRDFWNDLVALLIAVAATIAMGLLTSCRAKVVTVPEVHTSYVRTVDTAHVYHRDSVYRRDSVYTTVYVEGDTVYRVAHFYHWNTDWKDRISYKVRTDTVVRVDSVSVAVPVVKEKKVVPGWAWTLLVAEALAAGCGVVVWWYRRFK